MPLSPGAPAVPFDIATGFTFSAGATSLVFTGTPLTASDLSALYQPYVGSVLAKPFGSIQISATLQSGAVPLPLPAAVYPALATLAVLPLTRHRRPA